MKILAVLITLSLILALGFLYAFFKAMKSGQFDDLESPAIKVLDIKISKTKKSK